MKRARHKKDSGMLHKIEHAIDVSIPYLLIALLIITSIDLFYAEMAEQYAYQIEFVDEIIILLFVIDLAFKYRHARSVPEFLRSNWLDIVAVLPFYMVFRLVDEFVLASEVVKEGQQTLHIAEGVEKEAATAAKDIKEAKIITRSEKMLKELRVISRVPRFAKFARLIPHFAKAARFFETPKHVRTS